MQSIPKQVFLNYAREDKERAVWLRDKLQEAGVVGVWVDISEIEGGEQWKKEIDNGLRDSTVLLALLTKGSLDRSRKWIEYERSEARRLGKPVIPLRFEGELPEHLSQWQCIDFTGDKDEAFSALLKAVANFTRAPRLLAVPRPIGDPFVGRETDIQELLAFIDAPRSQVKTAVESIAIHGMGGQGKTMLAQELVRRIYRRYPGGLLDEQRGQSPLPARVVLQKWARLAGHDPTGEYDSDRVRLLLSGHGEMLVLIDDVNEADFEATRELLTALPSDATRLLTTRSENIASELGCLLFPLSRLNDDDACELVRERLRARMGARVVPVDLSAHEAAIRRLVDLVEGHALTLEVTAARCDSPEQLPRVVDRLAISLSKGLDDVDVDRRHGVNKDNSVVASLKLSLEQLGEYHEDLPKRFAALGVFPDGARMNLRLIAAVWGDAEDYDVRTDNALSEIYRLAMIKLEPGEIYQFHPMQRWFAHNRLSKDAELLAATPRRYRAFLTRTAEQAFSKPEEHWLSMEIYTPHLLHTAKEIWDESTLLLGDLNALAEPEAPVAGITIANPAAREAISEAANFALALMGYVLRRPALGEEGRRILTLGLASVRATGNEALQDTFVRALGAWYARGNTHAAERYFQQALRWAEHTGDRAEQGKVLSDYGELQRNRTKLDEAIELLDRALAIHEQLGDLRMQAVTLKSSGEAHGRQGDFDIAMDHYGRALELYGRLEDRSGEADLLNKIGSLEFNRGNYENAISQFRKALPMHRKLGNRSMEAEDLNDMAISCNYRKRPRRALKLLDEAIAIHHQLGNYRLEALAISNRAAAFYALGEHDPSDYEKAVIEARKSRDLAREIEDILTAVWAMNWEALAQQKLGRPDLALPVLEQAVALLDQTGPRERVSTWGNLGYLLGKDLGQRKRGAELLAKAIKLMREEAFTRAFGGRTLADLEAALREFNF